MRSRETEEEQVSKGTKEQRNRGGKGLRFSDALFQALKKNTSFCAQRFAFIVFLLIDISQVKRKNEVVFNFGKGALCNIEKTPSLTLSSITIPFSNICRNRRGSPS